MMTTNVLENRKNIINFLKGGGNWKHFENNKVTKTLAAGGKKWFKELRKFEKIMDWLQEAVTIVSYWSMAWITKKAKI